MRANLADRLGVDPAAVSVKATTTDGLGWLGADEGIAATAVVMLGPIVGSAWKVLKERRAGS